MIKIIWSKYIKYGPFTSKHGIELPYKWEFDRIKNEHRDKEIILTYILSASVTFDLIAIDTVHPKELEKYCDAIYYPSTKVLEFKSQKTELGKYMIYDDVITTGFTILELINKIGKEPEHCLCLIDRRSEAQSFKSEILHSWSLNVISLFEILNKKE